MDFDKIDRKIRNRRKEWMFPLGILFLIMAAIIFFRNLIVISTELGTEFFIDNFTNSAITNEKFVIVMVIIGAVLIYFGKIKRKDHPTNI
ncbi:MAG TPA: hypothetical protein VN704_07340 [Verrucomicrobiae bacterium]|nr:hypothetical protein [Verrucomicrobiae bacterium]